MNNMDVEFVQLTDEDKASADMKAKNPNNQYPFLETPEGNIWNHHAISKYLASGSSTLLGSNATERA